MVLWILAALKLLVRWPAHVSASSLLLPFLYGSPQRGEGALRRFNADSKPEMAGASLPAWHARTADRSGPSHKEFQLHIVYSFLNSIAVAALLIPNGLLLIRLCVYLFTYNVYIDCARFQNDGSGKWCRVQTDLDKHG
jgi:hypothetical protein